MKTSTRLRRRLTTMLAASLLAGLAAPAFCQADGTSSPLPNGAVGVGAYATVAQFKDLRVVAGNDILLEKTLGEGMAGLRVGAGQWKIVDGVLQQGDTASNGMNIFTGDAAWTDYTVTVKARKISGKEGFSLACRARDDKNFACLNVGGWGNTKAQFGITVNGNFSAIGDSSPVKVEGNRWYDVKIDVQGDQATGYVDDKKVASAILVPPPPAPANGGRNGGNRGAGGFRPGGGNSPSNGGGAAVPVSPIAESSSTPVESTLWGKVLFAGGTAIFAGAVVAGFLWLHNRTANKST